MREIIRTIGIVLLVLAVPCGAIDFSPVTDPIGDYVASHPDISGAGLLLMNFDGTVLLEQYWGEFDRHSIVRLASATKWFSGTAIMSLVDDGLLDLDLHVGEILPSFAGKPDGKDEITVRQMFSHTSGLPSRTIWERWGAITLEQAANGIAQNVDMESAPGAEFRYGSASMQVAGRIAEVVAGKSWKMLFEERVTNPLGVTDTDFLGFESTVINPQIAAGGRSSIDSYERLLRMLIDDGCYNGLQVLSSEAVAVILSDQTVGAVPYDLPTTLNEYLGYGIGNWIFRLDENDEPVEFASPGAFGTTPWIDFEYGYYGVFMIDDLNVNIDPYIDNLRAFTRDALKETVDLADFAILAADWQKPQGSYDGDITGPNGIPDGYVNMYDLVKFCDDWLR